MTAQIMLGVGLAALIAGLVLARRRVRAARGADKLVALGPVFEATALAMFAAEHGAAANGLSQMVPQWLPAPLFWTYFFGVALHAAATSFLIGKLVRVSAPLLGLMFLIFVVAMDVPEIPANVRDPRFWILVLRETSFACGAFVLAGSVWPSGTAKTVVVAVSRRVVAAVMVFYGIAHFYYTRSVPGVPLEKPQPDWVPAPQLLSYLVGAVLIAAGIGLCARRTIRIAAASAGAVLLTLVVAYYMPIFVIGLGLHDDAAAVEGANYVGDTLLYASTILLAGS